MYLEINKEIKSRLRNIYQINVEFMFGNYDGEETLNFYYTKEEYETNPKELHEFIKHIQSCIAIDSKGRGGFRSSNEAIKWYGLGLDWRSTFIPAYKWGKYCEDSYNGWYDEDEIEFDKIDKLDKNSKFLYSIPAYDDGWYGSYENIEILYYNEEGNIHNVNIIEDEN